MNILAEIADYAKVRVEEAKKIASLSEIKKQTETTSLESFRLEKSILSFKEKSEIAFICEVKKASPSKGLIDPNFNYIQIAKEYQNANAAGISVLTEPKWFKGENKFLTEISNAVKTPLLRKDFTVDEYQIYEAKAIGASAVLLIVSILTETELKNFIKIAEELGLNALVETHDKDEVKRAIDAGAKILGINNRDLKTFNVDLNTTLQLASMVPKDILLVSESGIKTPKNIQTLKQAGVSAVLIGETLMRSQNKAKMLDELRKGTKE